MGACGDAYSRGTLKHLQTKAPYYYVENLRESFHRVGTRLEPANCYAWSVRVRTGNVPGRWSTITRSDVLGASTEAGYQRFELFMTRSVPK